MNTLTSTGVIWCPVYATAEWVYDWDFEDGKPLVPIYRVQGGTYDKSDVTAETLIKLGIAVPARQVAA